MEPSNTAYLDIRLSTASGTLWKRVPLIAEQTMRLSIKLGQPPNISIFGQLVVFSRQEYALLAYLCVHKDELCPYQAIIAQLWAPKPRTPERIYAYLERLYTDPDEFSIKKEDYLDPLIHKVRRKINEASGGVTLIETVRGEGLCLRT